MCFTPRVFIQRVYRLFMNLHPRGNSDWPNNDVVNQQRFTTHTNIFCFTPNQSHVPCTTHIPFTFSYISRCIHTFLFCRLFFIIAIRRFHCCRWPLIRRILVHEWMLCSWYISMWFFTMLYLHFLVMFQHDVHTVIHRIEHISFGTPTTHIFVMRMFKFC